MDFPHSLQNEHLMTAIGCHDYQTVRKAIKRGADVNSRSSYGNTPLTYAVEKGYADIVQLLLDSGANPNDRTQTVFGYEVQQYTPLLAAINMLAVVEHEKNCPYKVPKGNLLACMELLLEKKADPNRTGLVYCNIEEINEVTPLFQAARYDQLECVLLLVHHGADVNLRDRSHYSPLSVAIMNDSRSCIETLLKYGASVTYIERERAAAKKIALPPDIGTNKDRQQAGETIPVDLHSLVWEGCHQTLESALKKGADINRTEINGDTPLHFATKVGYLDCMRVLLENNASLSIKNKEGLTALHSATLSVSDLPLSLLLRSGTKVDINVASSTGETPLHFAVFHKKEHYVKLLLDKGADPNAVSNSGDTPLHWAVHLKSKPCISMLLSRGANVFIQNRVNKTPLHLAAEWSINYFDRLLPRDINQEGPQGETAAHVAAAHKVEYLQHVLKKGANANAQTHCDKITPLHVAAVHGIEANVKLLLQNGVSANVMDIENETPLHYSVYWGHKVCAEILLNAGARTTNTLYSTTPLHIAATVGDEDCTRMLIRRCCPVDVRNERNNTPLYESILAGSTNCIPLLVERGADIFARCQFGDTPLQLASRQGATFFSLVTEKLQPEQRVSLHHSNGIPRIGLYRENPEPPTSPPTKDTELHGGNPEPLTSPPTEDTELHGGNPNASI